MELQLRNRLAQYLNGEVTLEDFEEWFLAATWDDGQDGDLGALVSAIRHRLAEFSNGDWSEAELKDLLKPLAVRYHLTLGWAGQRPHVFGATQGVPLRPFVVAGRSRAKASA